MRSQELSQRFQAAFGRKPRLARAPGRVNVIGEHTDYNDGFVMPAALAFETRVAYAPRSDRRLRIQSLAGGEAVELDLSEAAPSPRKDWTDYVRGVALMLARDGVATTGADMLFSSDVPIGAGLSSSAALEVSTGYALLRLADAAFDRVVLAKACQRAENEFVGMRCGIMDQFIACNAVAGAALLIDCRSLEGRPVAIDPKARIVVANSMVKHQLAGANDYNSRREACEEGVARLKRRLSAIKALRDVTHAQLNASRGDLSELVFRRCRHVVTENERVLAAEAALKRGDLQDAGRLMNEFHLSMRDDFEITCPEIDTLVSIAQAIPGVHGSRMTGGGFGGCTVSLVAADKAEAIMARMRADYKAASGHAADIFACSPGAGVSDLA